MAYPKPLSEKSLARLYAQSGLSEKQIDYLHRFFRACANLYGAIDLHAVWDLYREELMSMRIHRKDFYFFPGSHAVNPSRMLSMRSMNSTRTKNAQMAVGRSFLPLWS